MKKISIKGLSDAEIKKILREKNAQIVIETPEELKRCIDIEDEINIEYGFNLLF